MPKKHQENTHGDNVGRDKITNVKIPFKSILSLAILGLLVFVGYENKSKISHYFGGDKVFEVDDPRFKILIVPFKVMCDYDRNKDIGLHIKERLNELNLKDTLNIYPYYLDIPISKNFDADSAKHLQKHHNADQIIYGSYYDDACSDVDGDEVCYNWYTDEKWGIDSLYQENLLTSSNYQKATTQDIREGKIQGSTDYVIYWIAGLTAYNQVQYSKALKHWRYIYETLNVREDWSLLNKLRDASKELGYYQDAFQYNRELLSISLTEKDSAIAINNLAILYQGLGKYKKAKDLLEQVLESAIKHFGESHPSTAIRRSNLALVYQGLGEYEKAKDLLEQALESDIKNFGESHPSTAISRSNLAILFQDLGEYEKAKDLLEQALESAIETFGESHPSTAIRHSNLALVYQDLGEYEKAKDLLEQALESDINNFGESHPSTAISRSNLATVHKALGEFEKAKDLLEQALESDIKTFGESHPTLAINRSNLALVYQDLGNYEKAKDLLEQALESDIKNFGKEHPTTAIRRSNLATVYQALGDYEKARDLFQKAFDTLKSVLGEDHPNTKTVKQWLDSME